MFKNLFEKTAFKFCLFSCLFPPLFLALRLLIFTSLQNYIHFKFANALIIFLMHYTYWYCTCFFYNVSNTFYCCRSDDFSWRGLSYDRQVLSKFSRFYSSLTLIFSFFFACSKWRRCECTSTMIWYSYSRALSRLWTLHFTCCAHTSIHYV